MSSEFWVPAVSEDVTEHVLRFRDDDVVRRRFDMLVDLGFQVGDCRVWIGAMSSEGYGVFALPREGRTKRVVRAHRAAYLWAFGEPPPEYPFLDHPPSCVGRFCVNAYHLRPVTNAENTKYGTGRGKAIQRELRRLELIERDGRREAGEWGLI